VRRRPLLLAGGVLLAVLVLGGIGAAAMFKATSTHQFCGSCHLMRPYVDAWSGSRHSKVECVQCHFPPDFKEALWVKFQASTQLAKWATSTYSSKPFADVRDASCLRSGCHAAQSVDQNAPLVFKRVTGFRHGVHLDPAKTGLSLRCTSCHAQMVVEKHFEVTQTACFTCHFKAGRAERELTALGGCTGCHGAPSQDIALPSGPFNHKEILGRGVACQSCHINVVQGAGEAPAERCIGCHNEREKFGAASDVRLVHRAHVTERSIECVRCHSEIEHRLPPLPGRATTATAPGAPVTAQR
jgi:nitrate/TMAO reductase-like tetraheme cytochrome c subunit